MIRFCRKCLQIYQFTIVVRHKVFVLRSHNNRKKYRTMASRFMCETTKKKNKICITRSAKNYHEFERLGRFIQQLLYAFYYLATTTTAAINPKKEQQTGTPILSRQRSSEAVFFSCNRILASCDCSCVDLNGHDTLFLIIIYSFFCNMIITHPCNKVI